MFSEFDRQMFGGFANSPFFIDQTFESPRRLEGKGGRRKQQQQLSGKNEGEKKEGEGQKELDENQTVIQAVDGSNDTGESNTNQPTTQSQNLIPRSNLFTWPFDLSSSSPFSSSLISPSSSLTSSSSILPHIKLDLIEEKNQYLLHADVPGFQRDELKVKIEDGMLILKGEKKYEKEEKNEDKKYHRMERSSGKVIRSIRLPMDVKEDGIQASCENGVLKIIIPKDEEAKNKKQEKEIQIQ